MVITQGQRYYLALFSEQSWNEFRASGGTVYGTKKSQAARGEKLRRGDLLLCYVSKKSVFTGVLRVVDKARLDETPLYGQDIFPVRVDVEIIEAVDPDLGVPVMAIWDQLKIFKTLKNPSRWGGFFLKALNQFPEEDGVIIQRTLREWEPQIRAPAAIGTYRELIRDVVRAIIAEKGKNEFTIDEVKLRFRNLNKKACSDNTISIYISTIYCVNPKRKNESNSDYERIGQGVYRLLERCE